MNDSKLSFLGNHEVLVLSICSISTFFLGIIDFMTLTEGINTYLTFIFLGVLMSFLTFQIRNNSSLIWNFLILSIIFFVFEVINLFVFSFFPARAFLLGYTIIFSMLLVTSFNSIRKHSIQFNLNESQILLFQIPFLIAFAFGYFMQWKV